MPEKIREWAARLRKKAFGRSEPERLSFIVDKYAAGIRGEYGHGGDLALLHPISYPVFKKYTSGNELYAHAWFATQEEANNYVSIMNARIEGRESES